MKQILEDTEFFYAEFFDIKSLSHIVHLGIIAADIASLDGHILGRESKSLEKIKNQPRMINQSASKSDFCSVSKNTLFLSCGSRKGMCGAGGGGNMLFSFELGNGIKNWFQLSLNNLTY